MPIPGKMKSGFNRSVTSLISVQGPKYSSVKPFLLKFSANVSKSFDWDSSERVLFLIISTLFWKYSLVLFFHLLSSP